MCTPSTAAPTAWTTEPKACLAVSLAYRSPSAPRGFGLLPGYSTIWVTPIQVRRKDQIPRMPAPTQRNGRGPMLGRVSSPCLSNAVPSFNLQRFSSGIFLASGSLSRATDLASIRANFISCRVCILGGGAGGNKERVKMWILGKEREEK